MPGFLLPCHILSFLLLASCQVTPVNIIIPLTQPKNAVNLSPSFVSLSIEGDRWTEWVKTTSGSLNNFFFNTLDNLRKLTGEPPRIRIGANSADNTFFGGNVSSVPLPSGVKSLANHSCQVFGSSFPKGTTPTPYPEATNVTVNDEYYKAAQFLPQSMSILSLSPSHLAIYLDWYRYFGNFWCESQTKQLAGNTSRSHIHYKRVFGPFYQKCQYIPRGYRGWQRSRSLLK